MDGLKYPNDKSTGKKRCCDNRTNGPTLHIAKSKV